MLFLTTLVITTVLVVALQKPLKRWPVVFYVLALLMSGVYVYAILFGAAVELWRYFLIYMQRCMIALSLFTLVMFAAVFPNNSRPYNLLMGLRRELSITGFFFAVGHIVAYLHNFLPRLMGFAVDTRTNLMISLAIALVITALLVLLTVTSFTVVRRAMSQTAWKRVQLLAYPFYLLVYVHLMFVLLPSALAGGANASVTITVYTLLFASYSVLRVRKVIVASRSTELAPQED